MSYTAERVGMALLALPFIVHAQIIGAQTIGMQTIVANGTWGGTGLRVEVSSTGADVEFDCAHGRIEGTIHLGKTGSFDVKGTFAPEHGGPILRDEDAAAYAARYKGRVAGDTMTVTVLQGTTKIGPFRIKRGARPILRKCR